jgi:hypothetical protein
MWLLWLLISFSRFRRSLDNRRFESRDCQRRSSTLKMKRHFRSTFVEFKFIMRLTETIVKSKYLMLSFWLRTHAFILRYVLHQTVKNILQRRKFQTVYFIVNLLISTNKEILIDDHLFFFFNFAEIIENYAFWALRRFNEHFKYSSDVSWWLDENHARSAWRLFSVLIDERHIKFT